MTLDDSPYLHGAMVRSIGPSVPLDPPGMETGTTYFLDRNTLGIGHAPLAASCREVPARLFMLVPTSGKSDSRSTSSDHNGASLARTPQHRLRSRRKGPHPEPGVIERADYECSGRHAERPTPKSRGVGRVIAARILGISTRNTRSTSPTAIPTKWRR